MTTSSARYVRAGAMTLLAGLGLALSSAAQAQVAAKPAAPSSGLLPRAEFIRDMDAEFSKMDSDRNGQLTQVEIESFQGAAQLAQFQRRNRTLFTTLDADHNGQITPVEFAALVPKKASADGRPMIAQMDKNSDKSVSLIEHRTATVANFDKLDTDKDGIVGQAEMRAGGIIK